MTTEKTYTQSVHFRIIIEGDYSCGNSFDEELCQSADEFHDIVLDHVGDNIIHYFSNADVTLTDLKTIEERN